MQRAIAMRPGYAAPQLQHPAAGGVLATAGYRSGDQKSSLPLQPTESCLLVIVNRTSETLSLAAAADTPVGHCFLDQLSADLEPGGSIAFSSCLSSELTVDFCQGPHELVLQGNELRLHPGHGLRQKMTPLGAAFPSRYLLVVEVDALVASARAIERSSLGQVLVRASPFEAGLEPLLLRATQALPSHCTVFWPRGKLPEALQELGPEAALLRVTVPMALFFQSRKGSSETTMDNTPVKFTALPSGEVMVEVPLGPPAGMLRLRSHGKPLRALERFQLVYLCEVSPPVR